VALRLYADECVDGRIIAGLRRRGVDVVTAHEQGLLGAADQEHLARAIELHRVIVTADHDFLSLIQLQLETGSFPGLIFILPATAVGEAVRAIVLVATVLEPQDVANWIEWVP